MPNIKHFYFTRFPILYPKTRPKKNVIAIKAMTFGPKKKVVNIFILLVFQYCI